MIRILFFTLMLVFTAEVSGQQDFPLNEYAELPNPRPSDTTLWARVPEISVQWGDVDTRYMKEKPFISSDPKVTETLSAWRGESVAAQFVISTRNQLDNLTYSVSSLVNVDDRKQIVGSEAVFSGFVRYVMTDELNKNGKGACGHRNPSDFDFSLAADAIDHISSSLSVGSMTSRPVWIRIDIPQTTPKGLYTGNVTVRNGSEVIGELALKVRVTDEVLPLPADWMYHLDLWQNPYAVARYYQVTPWSEAHLDALRLEHTLYAQAGGKVITASIIHDPWNSQTEDPYESMIKWIKESDGNWKFDFSIFDTWVELMMSLGVDKQINCYSMIPWKLSFRYFDEAAQIYIDAQTAPGDTLYEEMWTTMLRTFAAHLKEKGWFEKTFISMDERPMDAMIKTLEVIRKADPQLKVSLAGALHTELIDELDDYCVALRMKYTDEMLARRNESGKVTTFYTSCEESQPNTFTFSPPAESEWFAWYAAKAGLDGYLRWALNCWVEQPLLDSRFRSWAAGDTYLIYPNARTSIRFERMKAGIQMYEKISILRDKFKTANDVKSLEIIENTLARFDENTLSAVPASEQINSARLIINGLVSPYDRLAGAISQAKFSVNDAVSEEKSTGFVRKIKKLKHEIETAEAKINSAKLTDKQCTATADKLYKKTSDFVKAADKYRTK